MAAHVILISSDSSKESMGSHAPRVILFGTIPTSILEIPMVPTEVSIIPADPLVALEVGAVSVISPTGVLDLEDYSSSSDFDPSDDSLPPALEIPLVSLFLCYDDSEEDRSHLCHPHRHDHYLLTHLPPSSEFPVALVVAPPRIHRRPAILIRPEEVIPIGRPYRAHPNGPCKLLTVKTRVGPFPAHKLAWRHISHHLSDRHSSTNSTSDSSSSGSSLNSSSDISSGSTLYSLSDTSSVHFLRRDTLDQTHSRPSTRVSSPRNLKAQNLKIQTDNGTEFKNKKLRAFYAKIGIVHQTSIAQTPQQNGVVECRYRTLVKAARTMLIFSKAPEFLWAKAIATACFTHNRSIVHTWKMKTKADIGIFIGYSESSRGFRIYNRRTKKIMETIHVKFDELIDMASECNNLEPKINCTNFYDSSEDS
nr:ribonuclease H-like domain-containing protein [Tanacetum cinerariifolium]